MAKSNIRSMRFSDTMIEIIEEQAGDTFTAKFDALVTRCMLELPEKERRIAELDRQIKQKREYINELYERAQLMQTTCRKLESAMNRLIEMISSATEEWEA